MIYSFDTDLAVKYGVDEAIILQNIVFWIEKNMANNRHFHDGKYWTYNSIAAFEKLFPFWNWNKIRRIIDSLIEQDVLVKGNYNDAGFDKTSWYALSDSATSIIQICHIELANLPHRSGNSATPIPDSKPDVKPDNKPDKSSRKQKIEKTGYGYNGNVRLSKEELNKLLEQYYEPPLMNEIGKMALWLEDNQDRASNVKSHYRMLLRWLRNANITEKPEKPKPQAKTVDAFEQVSIESVASADCSEAKFSSPFLENQSLLNDIRKSVSKN